MKKILIGTLIALTLIGCGKSGKVEVKKDKRLTTLREYNENTQKIGPRKKIAIAKFRANTRVAKKQNVDTNLLDIMSTEFTKSGRFIVLERNSLDQVMQEINFSSTLGQGEVANLQSLIDADYIVTGAITKYAITTLGKKGLFSSGKEQRTEIAFDIRVIDVKTGRVILADTGEGVSTKETGTTLGTGTTSGYDPTLESDALRAAAIDSLDKLVKETDKAPWTAKIIKKSSGSIYINAGAKSNLPIGTELVVYRLGEPIEFEGKFFGYEEFEIGTAKVVRRLGDDASICEYNGSAFRGKGIVRLKKK